MSGTVPDSSVPTPRPSWESLVRVSQRRCVYLEGISLQKKIAPKIVPTSRGC